MHVTLEEIKNLREVGNHEVQDFIPWFAKNIGSLESLFR